MCFHTVQQRRLFPCHRIASELIDDFTIIISEVTNHFCSLLFSVSMHFRGEIEPYIEGLTGFQHFIRPSLIGQNQFTPCS